MPPLTETKPARPRHVNKPQQEIAHSRVALTDEGRACVAAGRTPEYELFAALPPNDGDGGSGDGGTGGGDGTGGGAAAAAAAAAAPTGVPLAELKARVSREAAEGGFKQAMANRWVSLDKPAGGGEPLVRRRPGLSGQADAALALLLAIDGGGPAAAAAAAEPAAAALKRRRLVKSEAWKTYRLAKGPHFSLERAHAAAELTSEMLARGTWRDARFKAYNFAALGRLQPPGGALHPLLKVRSQFRKIFAQMGFSEMPTANYVESAFWNFDALFQPQQHPARDAHDTFFLSHPARVNDLDAAAPADYRARVQEAHERGGYGSAGYGYCWKSAEAAKTLLRTHTTAVSSRMLFELAQGHRRREGEARAAAAAAKAALEAAEAAGDGAAALPAARAALAAASKPLPFQPAKYFSIDRVFRNEAVDRTHLAEFHQVEGLVCDVGLTLGDLIGTLRGFFARLGMTRLRFKPAYNPYTEPSMEVFAYSEELGKWMEVGNSGMFRPEMLGPMGFPPEARVIAWGLSLERPTMILYGVDNIRDLFGHKVSLSMVRKNPICRLGL